MTYVNGFVIPVPVENREAYLEAARKAWPLFKEYGAIEHVEAWSENIADGKQTDFKRAVAAKEGEAIVFSWLFWPDKATAERCEASMETDDRWKGMDMPFDGARMIYGGFDVIFQQRR